MYSIMFCPCFICFLLHESRLPEQGVVSVISCRKQLFRVCCLQYSYMATSSSSESNSSATSYSDTSCGVLSLFYSTSDASHERTDTPSGSQPRYFSLLNHNFRCIGFENRHNQFLVFNHLDHLCPTG